MQKPDAPRTDFDGADAGARARRALWPALSRCLGWPLAGSSRIEWIDAGRQRDAALAVVEAARDHVNLEGFRLDGAGALLAATLRRASARGVRVNAVGTLHGAERPAGAPRRLLVVDGALGLAACAGGWLRVCGPAAAALQALFLHDWLESATTALPRSHYFPALRECGTDGLGLADAPAFEQAVLGAIGAAQRSIVLAEPPTGSEQRRALDEAVARGVGVRFAAASRARRWWSPWGRPRPVHSPARGTIVVDGVWSGLAAGSRGGRDAVHLIVLGGAVGECVARAVCDGAPFEP